MNAARVRFAVTAIGIAAFSVALTASASAMPMFAKAYGLKCSACHTMVPALNAYGRYVQRTGYASLRRDVLDTTSPVWLGEQFNGDSTGGVSANSPTFTTSFGNAAIHAAGYVAPDVTYHVQQWLLQNDQTGGSLDTLWFTYNNLFHRDGHLFLGKLESPGPSPFSQWFDLSPLQTPEILVGEHQYQTDGNRWGTKVTYVRGPLDAEAGWLLGSANIIGASDFSPAPGTDKTFQWKLARARGDQPLEYGAYGTLGSFIVSTGAADHYTTFAGYVQEDPSASGLPGVLLTYQVGNDSNPGLDVLGNQLGRANSHAYSAEIYEPLFNNGAVLGVRSDLTDDGLGTTTHFGNIDLAFQLPHLPHFHAYVEAGLSGHSSNPSGGPDYRWTLWWTTPLGP